MEQLLSERAEDNWWTSGVRPEREAAFKCVLPLKKQSPMNSCLLLRSVTVCVSMLTTQSLKAKCKVCVCAVEGVYDCSTGALCYYLIKKSAHTHTHREKKPNSEM